MGELSFLTIIVSLAVCSLLVYAIFQYMKVRLTILEQSHKEQAMILQQYIEESSTDIHRLYQISSSSNGGTIPTNGSIILEYANEKPVAYNEPHIIHLDTAIFQNKRNSNLIEISSDSEDTTDESEDDGASSESDRDSNSNSEPELFNRENNFEVGTILDDDNDDNDEEYNAPVVFESVSAPEMKIVTVDLGITQEPEIQMIESSEQPNSVLSMLYKNTQDDESNVVPISITMPEESIELIEVAVEATTHVTTNSSSILPLTSLSVTELKSLLKEKYKSNPEKHAEIQKLKKAELIHALQQIQ